jgi:glycosyltransferase involved in cell wall biosynthesis
MSSSHRDPKLIVMFANTDWYLYNFRRSLALEIQSRGYDVLMISPPGEFGPRLRGLGLRWEALQMDRRSLRPQTEAAVIWRLTRMLRQENPFLIHNFTIKCVVYGSLAAALARVPCRIHAVTGMGYVFTSSDRRARALAPILRRLMSFAMSQPGMRVIVQNPDDEASLSRMGVKAANLRLIRGSGVDCRRFAPRPHKVRSVGRPRIIYTGRLLWDKGLGEFVEAAKLLRALKLDFVAAGSADPGNPAAVPKEKIQEWEAQGLVRFPGHVEDIPELLAEADVFVLPSYREGLPRSLIEAAACGLPLVATDVPGCREVITDGRDGLLVPPRDATALADAIRKLVEDPELASRLGANAREKAKAVFDEDLIIDSTLNVYRELFPDFPSRFRP